MTRVSRNRDLLNTAAYLPGNLIAQGFAGDNSDLLAYPLICVEIQSETWIVFLNNKLCGLLDRLRPNATLRTMEKRYGLVILHERTCVSFFTCTIVVCCTAKNHEHNLNPKSTSRDLRSSRPINNRTPVLSK